MDTKKIIELGYNDFLKEVKNKNGLVKYDYFLDKKKNNNNSKTSEGYEIHHDLENSIPNLSDFSMKKKISQNDILPLWEKAQKNYNLTYCDLMEHAWLHYLIFEEYPNKECPNSYLFNSTILGLGGLLKLIEKISRYFSKSIDGNRHPYRIKHKIGMFEKLIKIYTESDFIELVYETHKLIDEFGFDKIKE